MLVKKWVRNVTPTPTPMPKIDWLPARLVKASDRWYISYYAYCPKKGTRRKFRETFNLNRIHNLQKRERRAIHLIELLNWWVDSGNDPVDFSERAAIVAQQKATKVASISLVEGVELVLQLKEADLRKATMNSYRSVARLFLDFAERKGWSNIDCQQFSKAYAAAYMDSCVIERKLSATSYNNNIRQLRAIFSVLEEKGYVESNVWQELKYKRPGEKLRRNFSHNEARVVINHIRENDDVLFLALLLQYCCFLRPSEMIRLRIGNINMEVGVIFVDHSQSKTGHSRTVTIPDDFLPFFPTYFEQYPDDYFLFGLNLQPHRSKQAGHSSLYKRHQKIIKLLHSKGELADIKGLQWYSWKDTGITDLADYMDIMSIADQAGHHSPTMTLKYRHKKKINRKIKEGFRNDLIKKKPGE